jgi:hypothetical protein
MECWTMSSMNLGFVFTAIATAALGMAGCETTQPQPAQQWDGLELRPTKDVDALYVRPGVEFKAYKSVTIDPIVVAFDKNWDPNESSRELARRLSPEDIQKLKDDMAGEFRKIFSEELGKGGYSVLEQPAADTLRVMPALTDVYINAPDTLSAGRSYTFTMDPGRMTLVMELRDGPTGQILARVIDKKVGRDTGTLRLTNSVTNSADFRRAVESWATRLRQGLDRLNGKAG